MKNVAVCIFGADSTATVEEKIILPGCNTIIFKDTDVDKHNSLFRVSHDKRDFEISHDMEFDICIGIYAKTFVSLDELPIPDTLIGNRIYSSRGHFANDRWRTGISMNLFLCRSIEFDRAAEYIVNIPNIYEFPAHMRLNKGDEEEMFYFHLKSLYLTTECINVENSSMFIRSP